MLAAITPTVRRVAAQLHVAPSPGPLTAGAARVELTPPVGTSMAGYSRRAGKPSTGVHDPLYARALAVSDGDDLVLLITADLLIIPPGFHHEVVQRLNAALPTPLGEEDVLLAATHTHSGPGAYVPGPLGEITAGAYRPAMRARLAAVCAEAGLAAVRALQPAALGVVRAARPDLVENRVEPNGPVDPEVAVLAFVGAGEGPARRPIATLLNFAAHPTLLSSKNLAFSADFPGVACRLLEARQAGTVALFTNGAAGDLRPPHLRGLHNEALAEAIGEGLADSAVTALESAHWRDHVEVASLGGMFPLPPTRVTLGPVKVPHWFIHQWLPENALFTVVALGDVALVSGPADVASDIGLRIKRSLAARGLTGLIVGYANDYVGYIVPARLYQTDAYEAKMGWHGPTMETVYEAIVGGLTEEYLRQRTEAHHRPPAPADAPSGPAPSGIEEPVPSEMAGLPVVVLRGEPYAMGYAQGSRYRAQVQASVANLTAFVESKLPAFPWRLAFIRWRLSAAYAQMRPFIPAAYREELRGLAAGSGVPLAELERVHALPEVAAIWCTSGVAFGRATKDGRLLHLRNLDWAIHSDVQRYAALFVRHPTHGQATVVAGYFGFIGVLSGINESGISAGQIGADTEDQTIQGMPMPFVLRQALEEAGDLAAAAQVVQRAPRTAGFHYVFADARRRQAVVLETTRHHCAVFWAGDEAAKEVPYAVRMPDVLVRADPALDPEVRETQRCSGGRPGRPGLEPPTGSAYEIRYRQQALLMQEQYGRLDPEAMIAIARAIAPKSNVQSIVFADPDLWIATARGTTPAAQQPYLHYDLKELFARAE